MARAARRRRRRSGTPGKSSCLSLVAPFLHDHCAREDRSPGSTDSRGGVELRSRHGRHVTQGRGRGTFGAGVERTAIEFRVLGPLEVSSGGRPLSINGKPASLLALLLVHPNEVVSTDRLIDGLWGEA